MNCEKIIYKLKQMAEPSHLDGMQRFSIESSKALGVRLPYLRELAKTIGKDHNLALELWDAGVHEARILASMIDEPAKVTAEQMDKWTNDFSSWDLCDQVCGNLFDKTQYWVEKAFNYSGADQEFVKRAGFVLMATGAVHHKKEDDLTFIRFLPLIEQEAYDERNFVKKAVNWALRQIGKRNENLNRLAVKSALKISRQEASAAKWIAADALRELNHFEKFKC